MSETPMDVDFEMSKALPIWDHLPRFFKKSAIGLLDFKSRNIIRKVGLNERRIADTIPAFLSFIRVGPSSPYSSGMLTFKLPDSDCISHTVHHTQQQVIMDALAFCSHPNYTVDIIQFTATALMDFTPFMTRLNQEIANRGPNFRLRADKLLWTFGADSGKMFLETLKKFETGTLNTIQIGVPFDDDFTTVAIVDTPQWRGAKNISVLSPTEIDIEKLIHCDRILVNCHEVTIDDVLTCVETWKEKTPSHGPDAPEFVLHSVVRVRVIRVLQYLGYEEAYRWGRNKKQYFVTYRVSPTYAFLVRIGPHTVHGFFCRLGEHLQADVRAAIPQCPVRPRFLVLNGEGEDIVPPEEQDDDDTDFFVFL
ncbi:unnamed protein product [Caenorhabditis sp. 36 PRJEB53466]|nr:unnamed protein product [Caenorhabditis sp. 36 PRJEB53466]